VASGSRSAGPIVERYVSIEARPAYPVPEPCPSEALERPDINGAGVGRTLRRSLRGSHVRPRLLPC
jgi:hypothetical protein